MLHDSACICLEGRFLLMKLYVGGAWQGKCDYVSGKFQNKPTIVQGDRCTKEDMKNADIINHFHEYVYRCVQNGDGMDDFAEWIYEVNPSVCIICDEVGSELSRLIKICVITGNL